MYGIFSRSTIGATARPDELKPEPTTPRNLSSSATLFMWLTACDGFEPSSKSWTRTRRPLIPPRALISLTAASTPWRLSTPDERERSGQRRYLGEPDLSRCGAAAARCEQDEG